MFRQTALGTLAAVILLVIATSPFWAVLLIKRQTSRIVDDTLVGLTAIGLANVRVSDGFLETALAVTASDEAVRTRCLARIAEMTRNTDVLLRAYETAIKELPDRQNYERLVENRARFLQTRQKIVDLLGQGKREEALQLYSTDGLHQFDAYLDTLGQVVRYNVDEAKSRGSEILRLCNLVLIAQGVLLVFFFIYGFFVPLLTFLERLTTPKQVVEDI